MKAILCDWCKKHMNAVDEIARVQFIYAHHNGIKDFCNLSCFKKWIETMEVFKSV